MPETGHTISRKDEIPQIVYALFEDDWGGNVDVVSIHRSKKGAEEAREEVTKISRTTKFYHVEEIEITD